MIVGWWMSVRKQHNCFHICLRLSFQDRQMVGLSEFLFPNHALPLYLSRSFHSFSQSCYRHLNAPHFIHNIIRAYSISTVLNFFPSLVRCIESLMHKAQEKFNALSSLDKSNWEDSIYSSYYSQVNANTICFIHKSDGGWISSFAVQLTRPLILQINFEIHEKVSC